MFDTNVYSVDIGRDSNYTMFGMDLYDSNCGKFAVRVREVRMTDTTENNLIV